MNEIQVFNNSEFGEVRTLTLDGEPWFVGKDVAVALGYARPTDAIRKRVDDEDRGISKMETPSGKQQMTIINESGLYALIFGSKLESAKSFKHWVTSEVLPSIRKTGTYEQHTQLAPIAIQKFMERQQNLMEELVKMNQSMSERIAVLESKNKEPVGLIVGPGAKHYTVAEDENTSRKKKLNMLVTKMAKACGWTRSFALHRLYKTIEEVLDVSIDDYVDFYKEEVQGDACAIDAIAAYNHLYATAIRLCNNTLTQMSVEV